VPRIRDMTRDDHAAVMAVLQRNGLAVTRREDWLQVWEANPLHVLEAPMGWVLEEQGRGVVGTFSNLQVPYEWNRELVRVGVGFAWAVDRDFRRHAVGMLRRWMAQSRPDLLLTNTASARVGQILSAARFRPVPHPDYDQALYWVTDDRGFAASALRQVRAPAPEWLSCVVAPAMRVLRWTRSQRGPREPHSDVRALADFDGRFDAFWMKLRQTRDRLLALRSAAALRWHFKRARDSAGMVLLTLEERGELTGYLVMVRQDHAAIGLTRYRVADLQVLWDSPRTVRALVLGAIETASNEGVHVVEVVGLSSRKREALAALSPLRRRMPSWLFFYRVAEDGLAARLDRADAWDPSPFDGDATL